MLEGVGDEARQEAGVPLRGGAGGGAVSVVAGHGGGGVGDAIQARLRWEEVRRVGRGMRRGAR